MNVDMATYKAEFYSHYYEGGFARGMPTRWAGFTGGRGWRRSRPNVVNLITHLPVVGKVFQVLGGISTKRTTPSFAPETFVSWFRRRRPRNEGRPKILLWPDTFNNHFHPQTAIAAVEVLEAAGFQVTIPKVSLCCGRPLYDFGMLDKAKQLWREILDALRPEIEAGMPVVGLEPSCVAAFRDELLNLYPMDEDAKRLSKNTFILSEFLVKKAPDFRFPKLRRKAIVQKHCHHDHVMGFPDEAEALQKLGLDFDVLNSGCCGMAGSFGFEAEHYDISVKVGERVLLPAVREAPDDTLVIADGFSCREQIADLTGRGALHLAQVIRMAMREGPEGPSSRLPESNYEALGKWQPEAFLGGHGRGGGSGGAPGDRRGLCGQSRPAAVVPQVPSSGDLPMSGEIIKTEEAKWHKFGHVQLFARRDCAGQADQGRRHRPGRGPDPRPRREAPARRLRGPARAGPPRRPRHVSPAGALGRPGRPPRKSPRPGLKRRVR